MPGESIIVAYFSSEGRFEICEDYFDLASRTCASDCNGAVQSQLCLSSCPEGYKTQEGKCVRFCDSEAGFYPVGNQCRMCSGFVQSDLSCSTQQPESQPVEGQQCMYECILDENDS